VFRTIIPRNVRLAEAPSFGVPAMLHDRDSRGALAYLALAGELIRRAEEPEAYWAEMAPAPAEAAVPTEPGETVLTLVEDDAPPAAASEESAPSSTSVPYLTNH
jgi:hypothetical protein